MAPVWLRLSVRPNRVMAYYKRNDSDQWTKLGEEAFPAPSMYQFAYGGLALTSHADGTVATATFSNVTFNPWPTWSVSSIGGGVGSGSFDGSTATLANRGTDIWGTADQLTFLNTNYDGDGTLTARVLSIDNTNAWAKSGVMFRNTLLANSPHVSVFVTPGKGISMQYRSAAGGASAKVKQLPGAAPVWLRLTRSGDMFIGAWSADATTWTTIGSVTVSMPPEVRVGAAVTSHNAAASATSVLTGLSIGR